MKTKKNYFQGWYFKQSGKNTICFIPSYHIDNNGKISISLQVITDLNSYYAQIKANKFYVLKKPLYININDNVFSRQGIKLNIAANNLKVQADLKFNKTIKPFKNIMGPFKYLPFMQCKHYCISLHHNVEGCCNINGQYYQFDNGCGYIESDSGTSFPDMYIWSQYCGRYQEQPFSVMISAASIPFIFRNFKGCICIILFKGRQYLLATYRGAKINAFEKDCINISQDDYNFCANLVDNKSSYSLWAPEKGVMARTILESPCATVRYVFKHKGDIIFDYVSEKAGFEYSSK